MVAVAGCGSRVIGGDNQEDAGGAVRGTKNRDAASATDAPPTGSPDGSPDASPDTPPSGDGGIDQVTQSTPDVRPDVPATQCAPADKRCNGKVVQSCDTTGTWQDIAACPFLCLAGACTGVCAPGDVACAGVAPETCDVNGAWKVAADCPFACNRGACVGRCVPGAHQCTGAVRQICDGAGQWQDELTCPFACVGSDCTGVCVPGRTQCLAGTTQVCSAAGVWQTTGVATRELLMNGNFDVGETGWTNPGVPIVYPANGNNANGNPDVAALSPPDVAWFGGLSSENDTLSQSVAIPADASMLTLTFYYAVITEKTNANEVDVFDAQLVAGSQTIALAHLSNLSATDTWTLVTATLPATLAGQTATVRLHGLTNASNRLTSFYIDTVSLKAVSCP